MTTFKTAGLAVHLAILLSLGSTAFGKSPADIKLCEHIVQRTNNHTLDRLFIRRELVAPPSAKPTDEIVDEVLFSGRLDINNDGSDENVYVTGSENFESLHIDSGNAKIDPSALDVGNELGEQDVDHYKLLSYANKIYVLRHANNRPRSLIEFDKTFHGRAVCYFEDFRTSGGRNLVRLVSDYDVVVRAMHNETRNPWEYVFLKSDFDAAESLLAHGHKLSDSINSMSLLSWAAWQNKYDVVEWLLAHGASPAADKKDDTTPFSEALRTQNAWIAIALLRAGAPLTESEVFSVTEYASQHPNDGPLLIKEVISRLRRIPENLVRLSVTDFPALLGEFISTEYPVEVECLDWNAGHRASIPNYIVGTAYFKARQDTQKLLAKLYAGKTRAPIDKCADASYGTFEAGLEVVRYRRSEVTDQDFLLFSTSICFHFLTYECGTPSLQRDARAWAEKLTDTCRPEYAASLDLIACKVLSHYVAIAEVVFDKAVLIHPVDGRFFNWGSYFVTAKDLIAMYKKKNSITEKPN